MHSTSSSENMPSAEISLLPMSSSSARVRRARCRRAACRKYSCRPGRDISRRACGAASSNRPAFRSPAAYSGPSRSAISAEHFVAQRAELVLRVKHHGDQRRALHRIARRSSWLKLRFECRRHLHNPFSPSGPAQFRRASAVHFSQHDVRGSDARDHVGNQPALRQLRQDLQIHERRRAQSSRGRACASRRWLDEIA